MKKEILALFTFIFLFGIASAEVFVSQPAALYNVGDTLNMSTSIVSQAGESDYLTVELFCGSSSVRLFQNSYSPNIGDKIDIPILIKLVPSIIGDLRGDCFIRSSFGNELKNTNSFTISKDIDLSISTDGNLLAPKESALLTGKAVKKNGQLLSGSVEIIVKNLNISVSLPVVAGAFNETINIPEDARAGNYEVLVKAYEKDRNGIIINEGSASAYLNVRHVLKNVDVAVNTQNVTPGTDFVYTALLFDQAGETINEEATFSLYSPSLGEVAKKVVSGGVANDFVTSTNYTPGYWKLVIQKGDLSGEKQIYISEMKKASFTLINGTLMVENIGNVVYDEPIEISIGNQTNPQEMNLQIGEVKKFRLNAPTGEYAVKVKEGQNINDLGNVYLTGTGMSIKDNALEVAGKAQFWIWLFIIILLVAIAYVYYKRIAHKKYIGKTPARVENINVRHGGEMKAAGKVGRVGERQQCSVVSLKIKDIISLEKAGGSPSETISKIVRDAKDNKANIQTSGDYKLFIFAPLMTKEENNSLRAIKFAKSAEQKLVEHNKRYAQKLDFGLGVSMGEMIIESEDGRLKATAIGGTIVSSKKLAEQSKSNVFVSEEAYRKSMPKVKGEKVASANAWKVNSIVNRDMHADFIKGFMSKNK